MPLRLVELVMPPEAAEFCSQDWEEHTLLATWRSELEDGRKLVRVLVESEHAEKFLDHCQQGLGAYATFQGVVLPVEASLPRPEEKPPEKEESPPPEKKSFKERFLPSIGREELYNDLRAGTRMTAVYLVMVVLSALVAAIGVTRDNLAVIIGAMVIAPLLAPNMALSLATTLGDAPLARRAVAMVVVGVALAVGFSMMLGWFIDLEPLSQEILSRTRVDLSDLALALAAGAAGALSLSSGAGSALVGVMVAVALLPPLVTSGLLIGYGRPWPGLGAGLLFLANLICINFAGITTFWLQGIRPLDWREAREAKKSTATALTIWLLLLAAMVGIIFHMFEN
jgi:uncharacterized hydrophobic protein (TIGR00341 family)